MFMYYIRTVQSTRGYAFYCMPCAPANFLCIIFFHVLLLFHFHRETKRPIKAIDCRLRKLPKLPGYDIRAWTFKLLKSPRIDSNKSIPPAYVAWRAGTTTLFLLGRIRLIEGNANLFVLTWKRTLWQLFICFRPLLSKNLLGVVEHICRFWIFHRQSVKYMVSNIPPPHCKSVFICVLSQGVWKCWRQCRWTHPLVNFKW